jgi:transposase
VKVRWCSPLPENQGKLTPLFAAVRSFSLPLLPKLSPWDYARLYQNGPLGQPPVPPAQLALAIILQAYTGVSDDLKVRN